MSEDAIGGIIAFGLNHRTADVATRESVARDTEGRTELRRRLATELGLESSCVVSTCNRTEVYVEVPAAADAKKTARLAHEVVFPGLAIGRETYLHRGWDAIIHLFRLASGLDSMVLGESEILGQLRDAFREADREGDSGRVLRDLFRQALTLGKRVRTETDLGRGSLSVAAIAVQLARKVVGNFEDKRALIVGAGETGVLVGRHLAAAGTGEIVVLNRTRSRAEDLAAELNGRAGSLDDLPAELEGADLVVGCVERDEPTITADHLRGLRSRTRVVIDISVPRSVAPAVAEVPGVFAFDIDDLSALIETNRRDRLRQTSEVDALVVGEVHKFLSLQAYAGMTPLVTELQDAFDRTCDQAVEEGLAPERGAEMLTKRLLGAVMSALKESSRGRYRRDDVELAYRDHLERRPDGPDDPS